MKNLTIIGVGRVGGAFALALAGRGYEVRQLVVRSDKTARMIAARISPQPRVTAFDDLGPLDSSLVMIATQDGEIAEVVNVVSRHILPGTAVLHVSGALSSEVLEPLRKWGASVGSLHPLVSISDAELGEQRLLGAMFCIEGEVDAVKEARQISDALGGECFSIEPQFKSLYHAAAVTACGHLVSLIDVSVEMLEKCGIDEASGRRMLLPLIRSTIDNLSEQRLCDALTGPFARGDAGTFSAHLKTLQENVGDEIREVYLTLAERSVKLAARRGDNSAPTAEIAEKISLAKKNLKC